jgi:hypothetical protein
MFRVGNEHLNLQTKKTDTIRASDKHVNVLNWLNEATPRPQQVEIRATKTWARAWQRFPRGQGPTTWLIFIFQLMA